MHCHQCCTTHVSLTTLEAYKICDVLPPEERDTLLGESTRQADSNASDRELTTNALAELCASDADLPAENDASPSENCPLLTEDLCSIYAVRPLNCRCFTSRTPCGERGYADVDEAALAVNTLFLQTVEHLDADGCSGNLLDVLAVLAGDEKRRAYAGGSLHCTGSGLIANRPMKVLMLPPEQRERIAPILSKLRAIRI